MVAVPIGCLEDISLRALRILREVKLIICENPAVFRPLAEQYAVSARLTSYDRPPTARPDAAWIARLRQGESLAFVCDAGTPAIADPGQRLVRAALRHYIPVSALPGPAAALVALVASGLPSHRFIFDGFAPRDPAERALFFQHLARQERTTILYESGSALRQTLRAICEAAGAERRVAVACRLTQPAEAWARGTVEEVGAYFRRHRPRGEYTLVIEGAGQKAANGALA